MSAIGKLRIMEGGIVAFFCPGCKELHQVWTDRWTYNGNPHAPSFTPSIRVTSGHYAGGRNGKCWCTYEERYGEPPGFKCMECHSWVTDGKIQFYDDCSHELKGQLVDLPDIENIQ